MTRTFLLIIATPAELPSGSCWRSAIDVIGANFLQLGKTCERLGVEMTWESVDWRTIRITTDDYGYTALRLAYGERFISDSEGV